MKIKSAQLITDLITLTRQHLKYVESLKSKTEEELNRKKTAERWSVLECLKHLNLYGNFYLPEIEKRIKDTATHEEEEYKSGLLGNYFAKSMWPKEKLNKMKTFKSTNPINSKLDKRVLDEFIDQQQELLRLLNKSLHVNLNKVKTSISISRWIKLKLGDTLRVIIYHNERHIKQVERIIEETKAI